MSTNSKNSFDLDNNEVLADYRVAYMSRQASLIGRREVLSGRAKFGIFGDGKEVAQVALAKSFQKGDWRSGYYRDQTIMFALGTSDVKKFFAQLYADTNPEHEPASAGRQMNSHYSVRYVDKEGNWLDQTKQFNCAADLSPTAGQMARLLGLGYASKLYRNNNKTDSSKFSISGNEIAFGTIGDASTSEGLFWETLNAAGVLQVPVVLSVWDDGYGISVPKKYQTTKESISEITAGFKKGDNDTSGYYMETVPGWSYPELIKTYRDATSKVRETHTPALIHVQQLTQPQGHSTSGSHERYKDPERMQYEKDMDCLVKMKQWMIAELEISEDSIEKIEKETLDEVTSQQQQAWQELCEPIEKEREQVLSLYQKLESQCSSPDAVAQRRLALEKAPVLNRRTIASSIRRTLIDLDREQSPAVSALQNFLKDYTILNQQRYNSYLYAESKRSPVHQDQVLPNYNDKPERIDGSNVIRRCFDHHLENNPNLFIIGEDVGQLGGVNTEFEGLQEKYGINRITDTGIREATILGQGIGAAMRGLRPIVDIQYLDYVLYCLQGMSDDLATLHYRSAGGQIAPVIIRTKGHRLEGIWHTGSPMSTILNACRGLHFCVPRNMVQAAGMYNTLLSGDDPAFVCEVLNGYRIKEPVPDNLNEFKIKLGTAEVLKEGADVTLVTYGACVRVAEEAITMLEKANISVELVDARFLMPFDVGGIIASSIKKTNAVLFLDEDVQGGASAYMMQQTLDKNGAFNDLDSYPRCLSAQDHRSAYGSDGDYYSKPNAEDIYDTIYTIINERDPYHFPK